MTVIELMSLFFFKAVVTGYFNFTNSRPAGFYPYYVASLRYLEYDVHRTIQFATLTNAKAANRLGINESFTSPDSFDIRLHLWNETIVRIFLLYNEYSAINNRIFSGFI